MLRLLIAALLSVVVVTGCGGGGGGGGSPPPTTPQAQSIAFADVGPVYKFAGDTSYANVASGGAGSGAITYSSDTPAVANVNAQTGAITIVGGGVAQITASKAADSLYLAAQASYTLRIAPRSTSMSAWIGPSDTEFSIGSLPLVLNFTRSSDLGCNPANYTTCANGTQTPTSSSTQVDTVATLSQPAIYWLTHGTNVTQGIVLPEQKFANQMSPGVVVWNGKLWVVSDPAPNEVWSSIDGSNWQLEAANPGFSAREAFRLVVFNNALWVIGGTQGGTVLNDVWTSSDGKVWTPVTAAAAFQTRIYFAAAAFNGRLWVAGGWNGSVDLNDVWSSPDGVNWTQATSTATSSGREQEELVSFNGKLWLIGGWSTGFTQQDVWSSPDGTNWTEATHSAAFGPRFAEKVVSDGTTLWLTAGYNAYQSAQRDVWSSTDGATWVQVTSTAEFAARANHGSAAWNGQLWVIGGGGNEVWSSTAGVHWSKQSLSTRIPGDSALAAVAYQGRLWALGNELQLWSSADGLSWVEVTHAVPGPASYPYLLALPDRLLLIAGWQYTAPNYYRGVWQSTDGQNWTQVESAVPFSANNLTQVIQFNGQTFAFAGSAANASVPEVWSSSDALNWTRVVANAPFAPRANYSVLVYNNQLWVVGGTNNATGMNDVWSSPDGVTWAQVAASTALPAHTYGQSLVLNGTMCLYDGLYVYGGVPHSVWCSSDGINWTLKSSNAPYGPVALVGSTVFAIGNTFSNSAFADSNDLVWKSDDGVAWRLGYQNMMQFP